MKILSSRRQYYVARVSIFLLALALIAGMVGCGGAKYNLTMTVDPGGSGTAADLTGGSPYTAGAQIAIKAVALGSYQFVSWTASPAGGFGDASAAQTTFTMPAQDVIVTAHFVRVYSLTMNATAGGTATDNTHGSSYAAGTGVNIIAQAFAGYQFVQWTASAGTFADASAAQTTFTMPSQDVIVTAKFFLGQLIRTWTDLDTIRNNLGGNYLLMNNLDSTTAGYATLASNTANGGKGWVPIGNVTIGNFAGTFDGQGYEIKDVFINRPAENNVGLFGCSSGTIENVGVVDASVSGHLGVCGLVAVNNGTVSKSYSTGDVNGYESVGGLVGYNNGTVTDCYSTVQVSGSLKFFGGLVGYSDSGGLVRNSYSTGNVNGNNIDGGLVGYNGGIVGYSYSTGRVNGTTVGGLVGTGPGTVITSFWDTQTSGQGTSAGGTGKTTTEMKNIATFQDAGWGITFVDHPYDRNTGATWNIVDGVTYPFLSWQPV
jgi:hypothetical protein